MLVRKDYRDRALGLVAAFAVLGVGIKLTDAMAAPRTPEPAYALQAQGQASECSLARRAEDAIQVC